MLGLMKKDLLLIKNYLKIIGIVYVIYFILGLQGNLEISASISFLSIIILISTFSYDSLNKWDNYAITLPNGRRNVILSKYLISLIVTGLITLITLGLLFIIYIFNNKINIVETTYTLYYIFLTTLLIEAIFYPIIYKFGIEKSRIIFFLVFFVIFLLVYIINNGMHINILISLFNIFINYLLLITIVVFILSYIISRYIYAKKEF